jgi:hypothetical protein
MRLLSHARVRAVRPDRTKKATHTIAIDAQAVALPMVIETIKTKPTTEKRIVETTTAKITAETPSQAVGAPAIAETVAVDDANKSQPMSHLR